MEFITRYHYIKNYIMFLKAIQVKIYMVKSFKVKMK